MNNNIQFAKIDVRKQSRAKQIALVFLGAILLAIVSFFSVLSVRAYFTSTATKGGELSFGEIEVKLLNGENEFTASSFQTAYLKDVFPGSTLNFKDITVKNTGTHSAYVLLNLDISIPSKDGNANKLLHYNKWFNADGEEVNTTNMAINQTKPTLIASASSATTNIKWKVPNFVGNDYKTSTVTVNMTVYGTQTNLKDAVAYADHELYASYFICSNASKIANDNGTTYLGAEITTDPLRKIVTGKNLFNKSNASSYGYGGEMFVVDGVQCAKIYQTDGTYSISIQNIFKENTQYSIRFRETYVGTQGYVRVEFKYTDGTSYKESYYSGSTWETRTITSDVNKTISKICFSNAGNGVTYAYYVDLDSFQIEKGTTATTYEAYSGVEDTFDINTQTLTRNVAKVEFTGNEGGWQESSINESTERFMMKIPDITRTNAYCNICEFDNAQAWNRFDLVAQIDSTQLIRFYRPFFSGYLEGTSNNANWKAFLRERYNSGIPVTVWYVSSAAEADKQETILTSKNLYNGSQRLIFETGASDNTTTELAYIKISQNATESFGGDSIELGGDLFNYLYDKSYTISFKFRRYEGSNCSSLRASVGFYSDSTSVASDGTTNYIAENDEWVYVFVKVSSIKGLNLASVNKVNIWLANANSYTYRNFEIKDIQIEVGVAPTDFEGYDPTEYKRVNGVVLRQIGDVKDTYTASTKKITRNVNELVLTGNENWIQYGSAVVYLNLSSANYGLSQKVSTVICSHSPSSSSPSIFGAKMTNDNGTAIGFAQCYTGFGVSDLDGFKNYLKDEYAKGNPVTLWYVLKTAKTETLS